MTDHDLFAKANYSYPGSIIRCHPDAGVLTDPPSLMMSWDIAKWWNLDLAGDYATDVAMLGTPEILGSMGNLVGMLLAFMLMRTREDYHPNARRCLQVFHSQPSNIDPSTVDP